LTKQVWVAIAALLGFGAAAARASDVCNGLVPTAVRVAMEKQYPKFRLPNEADYNPGDIRDGHGGVQCLGIAKGTYHRGGGVEYALNITSTTAPHTVLVVAYQSGTTWQVELVWDWGSATLGSVYAGTASAGTYERTETLEGPANEPDERLAYKADHEGVVAGQIEASGAAFFFDGKRWIHIWVSS
jgi:hypothetical protein